VAGFFIGGINKRMPITHLGAGHLKAKPLIRVES